MERAELKVNAKVNTKWTKRDDRRAVTLKTPTGERTLWRTSGAGTETGKGALSIKGRSCGVTWKMEGEGRVRIIGRGKHLPLLAAILEADAGTLEGKGVVLEIGTDTVRTPEETPTETPTPAKGKGRNRAKATTKK